MAQRFDQVNFTVAREVSADGVRRYLVWTRRGDATVVHLYEAPSASEALRLAREELRQAEAVLSMV